MFYCEGRACSKRTQCIFHHPEKHPDINKYNLIEYCDQSLQGSAGCDCSGKTWETWHCGDNGNYALFEPILEDDYKGVLEAKLDEWNISLYHHDGSEKSIYELLYDIVSEIEPLIQRKINENQ